eukprot:s1196_g6.t1
MARRKPQTFHPSASFWLAAPGGPRALGWQRMTVSRHWKPASGDQRNFTAQAGRSDKTRIEDEPWGSSVRIGASLLVFTVLDPQGPITGLSQALESYVAAEMANFI